MYFFKQTFNIGQVPLVPHIPAIMPCITPGKKTLQFAQLAIGSPYPMAIGSHYLKVNIWTILAHTSTSLTLNNATLYNVYIPYITHLICLYCTLYHLLHLAYAVRLSLIHIFLSTYCYSFLYTCVYKVVVVKLLGYITC